MVQNSPHYNLHAIERETNEKFETVVRESLDRSKHARLQALILQKSIDFKNPLQNVELMQRYIFLVSEAKYGPKPDRLNMHWINPEELYAAIEHVALDSRVQFIAKDSIWMLCDLYAELRAMSLLVNSLFPGKVKRKMSNSLYKSFLILFSKIQYRLPYQEARKREVLTKNAQVLTLLLKIINGRFYSVQSDRENNDSVEFVENLLSGDIRKIQKKLFPLFYQMIVLNTDEKTNRFGSNSMAKTCLFFEIFRVIVPEKQFLTKDQFEIKFQSGNIDYTGNYSRYQYNLVRGLIGK